MRREVGVWGRNSSSPSALRVKVVRERAAARQREDVRIRKTSRFMSAKEVRFLEASRSIRFLGSGTYGEARLVRWGEQEAVLKKAS